MAVTVESRFSRTEWEHYLIQSYNLVKSKLTKTARKSIEILQAGTIHENHQGEDI